MTPTFVLQTARLRIAHLDRALAFYVHTLGFVARKLDNGETGLFVGDATRPILVLVERPGTKPKAAGAPGLFHVALLVPSRPALASTFRRLAEDDVELAGMADHGASEAIYLSDPDGNGLEIYADRPRESWPRRPTGAPALVTEPLDAATLLASTSDTRAAGVPSGTLVGHVHMRATSLDEAERFYGGVLGLTATVRDYPGALFMAADGYHHHVGLNLWGRSSPASKNDAGLDSLVIAVPAASPHVGKVLLSPEGTRIEVTALP